jgi:hypothetical protein
MAERVAAMNEKFFGFFRLVDACAKPGCPVCRCLDEDSRRHLDTIIYERVNDPGLRAALRASGGFCNWHAAILREIPDSAFGSAIISADLLARAREETRVHAERATRSGGLDWLARLLRRRTRVPLAGEAREIICPTCERLRDGERRYLAAAVRFTGDPQFDRAFDRSDGLCVPHVARLVTDNAGAPALARLVERSTAKWRQLGAALDAFVGKHEYRNQTPITDEESRSWGLVLEMLAGAPGVFGNELHSPSAVVAAEHVSPARAERPDRDEPLDVDTLRFEKEKLELRVKELTEQLGEASSRAAALHYRLWATLEDRRTLEMNLAGERGASKMWEQTVAELREENERLRRDVGGVAGRTPPGPADGR